jgi:hypothetical protein
MSGEPIEYPVRVSSKGGMWEVDAFDGQPRYYETLDEAEEAARLVAAPENRVVVIERRHKIA